MVTLALRRNETQTSEHRLNVEFWGGSVMILTSGIRINYSVL